MLWVSRGNREFEAWQLTIIAPYRSCPQWCNAGWQSCVRPSSLIIRYVGKLTKTDGRSGSKKDVIEMLDLAAKKGVKSYIEMLPSEYRLFLIDSPDGLTVPSERSWKGCEELEERQSSLPLCPEVRLPPTILSQLGELTERSCRADI